MFILLNILCIIIVFFIGADVFSLADEISYCASKEIDILKRKYSTCRECGHRLRVKDTFPVVSRFINKGKCRFCDAPFSKRGFYTEISGGFLSLLVYIVFYYIIRFPIFISAGLMIIVSIVVMLAVAFIYSKPYLKNRKEKSEKELKETKTDNIVKADKNKKNTAKKESKKNETAKKENDKINKAKKEIDKRNNKKNITKKETDKRDNKKNTRKNDIDKEQKEVDEIPKIDLF